MREIADGVWQVPLTVRDAVNAYVLGDVLVDAGTKGMGKKLPGKLAGRTIAAHTLTHAHPDHVGGSKPAVDALGLPFWAQAGDAPAVKRGYTVAPDGPLKGLIEKGASSTPSRSRASSARATRSPTGSSCSTRPATRRATSRSGACRTAS